jgi:hypothetical protein
VVEYYGRNRNLPPVVSPHNGYWFWREDAAGRDVVLSVAVGPEKLAPYFAQTRLLGTFRCRHCASFRPDIPIYISTGPVRPLLELLSEWRYFGIEPAPALMVESSEPRQPRRRWRPRFRAAAAPQMRRCSATRRARRAALHEDAVEVAY